MTVVPGRIIAPLHPIGRELFSPAPPNAKSYGDGVSALSPESKLPIYISILEPKIRTIPKEPCKRASRSNSMENSVSDIPSLYSAGIR